MDNNFKTAVLLMSASLSILSAKNENQPNISSDKMSKVITHDGQTKRKMKITVGKQMFFVTLNETKAAAAFKASLPLEIKMEELNANEKFFYLPVNLPTSPAPGGKIQAGDLMLYGNNCLVLFYKGFQTSYSYTRLGKIDNTADLVNALGSGNVTVKFEL